MLTNQVAAMAQNHYEYPPAHPALLDSLEGGMEAGLSHHQPSSMMSMNMLMKHHQSDWSHVPFVEVGQLEALSEQGVP